VNYTIRPYEVADKIFCIDAFNSNVPDFFAANEAEDFNNFLDNYTNQKQCLQNKMTTFYFVILVGNKIIGCGGYGDRFKNEHITLTWGMIHKAWHKKGFGKILLEFRIQVFKLNNKTGKISLDTTQHSQSFFAKFGFYVTKITKNFYGEGLDRYDMQLDND
jgi:[ribosomal protein S18]-alanine N-acetyltransferase